MTIESWRGVFNSLAKHFSGRSAKSITDNEAQDWIDSLVTEARSAVTVNNTWVRATKAVFGWGVRRKLLLHNPFAEVQIELPRQKRRRESKAFDEHELQVILKAAAAINDTAKPDDAAKRWMPWLLAYSGARPGEIGQLRGQDVRQDQGCWYLDLTPDAGLIKTGQARRVSERCTEPNGAVVAPPTAFTSKNLQDVK
jgi:integrase